MTATITPSELTAQSLMQSAYENRYTWDANFPGYTAEVTYTTSSAINKGKVRVNPNLSVEVLDISDETAKQAITQQMQEIATIPCIAIPKPTRSRAKVITLTTTLKWAATTFSAIAPSSPTAVLALLALAISNCYSSLLVCEECCKSVILLNKKLYLTILA